MKPSSKFTRFLSRHRDSMTPELRSLADQAQCAFYLMEKNPEVIEAEPRLKAICAAEINAFVVAYDAEKSRVGSR